MGTDKESVKREFRTGSALQSRLATTNTFVLSGNITASGAGYTAGERQSSQEQPCSQSEVDKLTEAARITQAGLQGERSRGKATVESRHPRKPCNLLQRASSR